MIVAICVAFWLLLGWVTMQMLIADYRRIRLDGCNWGNFWMAYGASPIFFVVLLAIWAGHYWREHFSMRGVQFPEWLRRVHGVRGDE